MKIPIQAIWILIIEYTKGTFDQKTQNKMLCHARTTYAFGNVFHPTL